MNAAIKNLLRSLQLVGPVGTIEVLGAKAEKRRNYRNMLNRVASEPRCATLRGLHSNTVTPNLSFAEKNDIVLAADAMLEDRNEFFTFAYRTSGIPRPWNYDPIENKYWPERHYTEQQLHAEDTPRDVKIVWELNRFKDLPILAEAALLTNEIRYAEEVHRRIRSWIGDNPFARSINWASALELAIRLLSWTGSLEILHRAGFDVHDDARLQQTIWEHAVYLASDLSTDKVVRTNHLIGEACGLFVTSLMWEYPEAREHERVAREILEREILAQTFRDGSTRESSTWYHRFVTDFFRIASRTATTAARPFGTLFHERLQKMEDFLLSMKSPENLLVRIGDSDDGKALELGNETEPRWEEYLFGAIPSYTAQARSVFPEGGYSILRRDRSMVAMRMGPFGMGGDGFSSHAHNDQLAPIVFLDGLPVLVDPGTYVYNGAPEKRSSYRGEDAHNTIVIGAESGAVQKLNFGWIKSREDARLIALDEEKGFCVAEFGEWAGSHERRVDLASDRVMIKDNLHVQASVIPNVKTVTWYLHLAPIWKLRSVEANVARFSAGSRKLLIQFDGPFAKISDKLSKYSPSYLREEPAAVLEAISNSLDAEFCITAILS